MHFLLCDCHIYTDFRVCMLCVWGNRPQNMSGLVCRVLHLNMLWNVPFFLVLNLSHLLVTLENSQFFHSAQCFISRVAILRKACISACRKAPKECGQHATNNWALEKGILLGLQQVCSAALLHSCSATLITVSLVIETSSLFGCSTCKSERGSKL